MKRRRKEAAPWPYFLVGEICSGSGKRWKLHKKVWGGGLWLMSGKCATEPLPINGCHQKCQKCATEVSVYLAKGHGPSSPSNGVDAAGFTSTLLLLRAVFAKSHKTERLLKRKNNDLAKPGGLLPNLITTVRFRADKSKKFPPFN